MRTTLLDIRKSRFPQAIGASNNVPSAPRKHIVNCASSDTKKVSQFSTSCARLVECSTNCLSHEAIQLRFWRFLWKVLQCASAFRNHIFNIIRRSSEKQMVRSDAKRCIADMTNELRFRYWSEMDHPRYAMYPCRSFVSDSARNCAVTITSSISRPHPASRGGIFWLCNALPKAFDDCFGKTLRFGEYGVRIVLHNKFSLLCHALGCSFTARAFSFSQILEGGQY